MDKLSVILTFNEQRFILLSLRNVNVTLGLSIDAYSRLANFYLKLIEKKKPNNTKYKSLFLPIKIQLKFS